MNHPVKNFSIPQSSSDSFFGMALAQAFTGMVFGDVASDICDAGKTLSAIHEDRYDQKRANGRGGVYELGAKKSLAGDFARITENTSIGEIEHIMFSQNRSRNASLALGF